MLSHECAIEENHAKACNSCGYFKFTPYFQNIVDAMMLGRYGNPAVSLSAAGIGGMLYFLTFPLIMDLATGEVAIIPRRWGKKNYKGAKFTLENLYVLLILISIPISLFDVFFRIDSPRCIRS